MASRASSVSHRQSGSRQHDTISGVALDQESRSYGQRQHDAMSGVVSEHEMAFYEDDWFHGGERKDSRAAADYEGAGFMGGISLGDDYHPNAPAAIRECRVKTISCGGCKKRIGYQEGTALNLKCSFCGTVTSVADGNKKDRASRPSAPKVDAILQCIKCNRFLAIPTQVASFQCGFCHQINIGCMVRKPKGHGMR